MLNHDLIEREKIIEGERMIGGGRDRFTNNLNKNIKNGRLSVTPAFIY